MDDRRVSRRRQRDAATYPAALAACTAAALVSMLSSFTLSYDAWSWLGFGREILHGTLDTTGGTAWKPLPALFTTAFSLAGDDAPWFWMAVARTGSIVALVLAFRVVWRLAPGVTGLAGGLLAAGAIAVIDGFYRAFAAGTSEGLFVAFVLLAVDRHLAGRPRQALLAGAGVALIRPDSWPLLGVYGLWLLWRHRSAWPLVVATGVVVPALWLGPELWGSGKLLTGAARGQQPAPYSYGGLPHPLALALGDVSASLLAPVALGLVPAIVLAIAARRHRTLLVLALGAAAWIGVLLAMMAAHLAGSPRFFMGAEAVLAVVAGAGWALALGHAQSALGAHTRLAARALAAAGIAGAAAALWLSGAPRLPALDLQRDRIAELARAEATLPTAIARAGGATRLARCGQAAAEKYSIPMVAWYLGVPAPTLTDMPPRHGYVLQQRDLVTGVFDYGPPHQARLAGHDAVWRVFARDCPAPTRRLRAA